MEMKNFENIGDGCVVVCFWSGGSLIILWDDKVDVTVNLFTYGEDIEIGDIFESNISEILGLSTKLRDEQPRGAGRVVSCKRDLLDTEMPPTICKYHTQYLLCREIYAYSPSTLCY